MNSSLPLCPNRFMFLLRLTLRLSLVAPLVLLMMCPLSVNGEMVTFQISGTMRSDSAEGGWATGDPFTSIYTFDSNTSGQYDSYNESTNYNGAIKTFAFTVAGTSYSRDFTTDPNGSSIMIKNGPFIDRYIASASFQTGPPPSEGVDLWLIQFDVIDSSGTLLSDDSLITSPSVLAPFANKYGRFLYSNNAQPQFTVSSISLVPEPSTYVMALAGLACGGFSMWRRRKRS